MDRRQAFLLIAAIGLVPIAFSYGVAPSKSLGYLFGLSVTTVDGTHIFRAVMGLYLALACFWVAGALKPHLTRAALWSLVVFMLGLTAGRVLSLMLDGWPHLLLVVYLLLELAFGAVGVMLLRAEPRQS